MKLVFQICRASSLVLQHQNNANFITKSSTIFGHITTKKNPEFGAFNINSNDENQTLDHDFWPGVYGMQPSYFTGIGS